MSTGVLFFGWSLVGVWVYESAMALRILGLLGFFLSLRWCREIVGCRGTGVSEMGIAVSNLG